MAARIRVAAGTGERSSAGPPGAIASRKLPSIWVRARVIWGARPLRSEPNRAAAVP